MSVGILLITHVNIASSLLETARKMLDSCPLTVHTVEVPLDAPLEETTSLATAYLNNLETGNGVLILTDIYGSTPSNIAKQFCNIYNCKLIAGLNLPMLVRILNYPELNMESLALKAVSGGHDGILLCECQEEQH